MKETLEDHLRRATRNFTSPLPEDDALRLGRDLARELALAHGETPPRYPELEPSAVSMVDGRPALGPSRAGGDAAEDLFRLGALVYFMVTGTRPHVSWRLDGPPPGAFSRLARRAAVMTLAAPRRSHRFSSASEAADALDALLLPGPEPAPPWPLFRGDAARSGARAGATASSLAPVWEARLGSAVASPVLTPAMALQATADGRLVFVDRRSGRRAFEMKLAGAIESTPALSGGVAHVGSDDGELIGVDAERGEVRYRIRLGKLVRSSPLPLPDGERVAVGVVDGRAAGALALIEPAKARVSWSRKLGAVFSSPTLAGDVLLVGSDDGSLYAVDVGKGTPAWSYRVGGKVRATPAVDAARAFVASFSGRVVAVELAGGGLAWSRDIGHPVYSSPCLVADLLVVGCNEGHVHGLDRSTGEPRFSLTTGGPVVASPAASGDRILVGSTDGELYLLDTTGAVVARLRLSASGVQASPALDGSQAYCGSADGLHALRLLP